MKHLAAGLYLFVLLLMALVGVLLPTAHPARVRDRLGCRLGHRPWHVRTGKGRVCIVCLRAWEG